MLKGLPVTTVIACFLCLFYTVCTRYVSTYTKMTGNSNSILDCSIKHVAVDPNGNAISTGTCANSLNFETFSIQAEYSSFDSSAALIFKTNRTGTHLWGSFYGNSKNDVVDDVTTDALGNSYHALSVGGNAYSTIAVGRFRVTTQGGPGDALLIKMDSNNNPTWVHLFASSAADYSNGLAVDAEGNSYLLGSTKGSGSFYSYQLDDIGPNKGLFDVFLAKINSQGTRVWHKMFGGTNNDRGQTIHIDGSGNLIVSITTWSNFTIEDTVLGSGCVLAKFNPVDGSLIWAKVLQVYFINSIDSDTNGNIYVTGQSRGPISDDMYLMQLNSNGDVLWSKQIGGRYSDTGESVRFDKKTNTLFWSGQFSATITINGQTITPVGVVTPTGIRNILFTQVNASDGSILWFTTVKGGEGYSSSIAIDNTGAIILAYNVYTATPPVTIQLNSTTLVSYNSFSILVSRFVPEATCFGISSVNSSVCSSQGTCNAEDVCSCYPNYTGDNCEIPMCHGIAATETTVCNFGNGTCITANTCNCTMGYSGEKCQIPPPIPQPTPKPTINITPTVTPVQSIIGADVVNGVSCSTLYITLTMILLVLTIVL